MEDGFVRDWTELANHYRSIGYLSKPLMTVVEYKLCWCRFIAALFNSSGPLGRIIRTGPDVAEEDSNKAYPASATCPVVGGWLDSLEEVHGQN
jgi:hypothetical protein